MTTISLPRCGGYGAVSVVLSVVDTTRAFYDTLPVNPVIRCDAHNAQASISRRRKNSRRPTILCIASARR